ncbi:MAG TPA: tetratricopeptide repeat protein [Pyrinomonadaceae bacterium]
MNVPRQHVYEFGDFRLDPGRRLLLRRDGRPVPLKPKIFETLLYLVEHDGRVLEKGELMRAVWPDTAVEENNLSQNISALRRALGETPGQHRYIVTVPGRGFRFVAAVSTRAETNALEGAAAVSADPAVKLPEAVSTVAGTDKPGGGPKSILRPFALACVLVAGLGAAGLILWRARTAPAPAASPAPASAPVKTIAVLPFKPLVEGEQDQALELGMAETLIAKLSNSREVVVRPISAVRRYGALEQDPQAAGRELNVESVLDGHIQRRGDHIRVSARLLSVGDGRQLWAGQFDEKMTDIFAVQNVISERVAAALALPLTGEERAHLTRRHTENVEAYQLYLRGRYSLSKRLPGALRQAIEHFRQAITLDANYAPAYAGLSSAYAFQSSAEFGGMPPREVMPKAKEAALKAVVLDDTLAEAHIAVGRAAVFERDWPTVEREYKRGLELDPDYSEGRQLYALFLLRMGRLDEALVEARRAWEIEPSSANKIVIVGWTHYFRREYDEAIEQYGQTLDMDPNNQPARFRLGLAYMQKGMPDRAVAELQRAANLSGGNARHVAFLGYAYALSGEWGKAERLLNELQTRSRQTYVCPYDIAIIHLGLGDKERALEWLEKTDRERDDWLLQLKVEPVMDSLRSEPRFRDLVRRVGLPQ